MSEPGSAPTPEQRAQWAREWDEEWGYKEPPDIEEPPWEP
jgi:hypothetical protein